MLVGRLVHHVGRGLLAGAANRVPPAVADGAAVHFQARGLAVKRKKAKDDGPKIRHKYSADLPTGWDALNIYKDGKPPEERPDEEYPDWLWTLTEQPPTLGELIRRAEAAFREGGEKEVMSRLSVEERRRLFSHTRKELIRRDNEHKRRKMFN